MPDLSDDERLSVGVLHALLFEHEETLEVLLPLAVRGDHEAQFLVGRTLWRKPAVNEADSKRQGFIYLSRSASQRSYMAIQELVLISSSQADSRLLAQLCEQECISVGYDWSDVVEAALAFSLRGDPRADYIIGMCYSYGWGVAIDRRSARKYFSRSWRNGFKLSSYQLCILYRIDQNVCAEFRSLAKLWEAQAARDGVGQISDWPQC